MAPPYLPGIEIHHGVGDNASMITEESRVNTPGGNLFFKRWRPAHHDAAPIVLFHDSLGCVELWRAFPQRLAMETGREVIAYDRLGFGKSDPHPDVLENDFITTEAHHGFSALHEHLALSRFIAFGHSVGGGMGAACAAAFPGQCVALITEAAQAFVEPRTREGVLAARKIFADEKQQDRLRRYHGEKAEWVLNAWIDTWLSEAFRDWSLEPTLREIRCPVLAMHGDRDEYGSVRHPECIAALVQGPASRRIIQGCGHVPHREKENEVLQAVTEFLSSPAVGA